MPHPRSRVAFGRPLALRAALSLAALVCAAAFTPLLYSADGKALSAIRRGATCARSVYAFGTAADQERPAAAADVLTVGVIDLGASPAARSFADSGVVSLVGGIESAIDPSLCRRLLRMAPGERGYATRCEHIERSVRTATEIWSRHHPTLYFNWTDRSEEAELVFLPGGAEFSTDESLKNVLAYETDLGDATVRTVTGTTGRLLRSRVVRHKIVINPEVCIFETDVHVRACAELGAHFALGVVAACAALTLAMLACAPLGRFGSWVGTRGRAALFVAALAAALSAELFGPVLALQYLALLNILVAGVAAFFYVSENASAAEVTDGEVAEQKLEAWKPGLLTMCRFRCSCSGGAFITAVTAASLLTLLLGVRLNSCGGAQPAHVLWGGLARGAWDDMFVKRCFRIDDVLAHEVGHALGLTHPDTGAVFIPANVSALGVLSAADHVAISAETPCEGLKIDLPLRSSSPFRSAIMFSSVVGSSAAAGAAQPPMELSEDDLAGIFFLYPSAARRREWGTGAIPASAYSTSKLRSIAEDFHAGRCAHLPRHSDMVECLLALRLRAALVALDRMARHRCGAHWRAQRAVRLELCDTIEDVTYSARLATSLAASGLLTPPLVAQHAAHLCAEQLRLEAALHDAPLRLTGLAGLDHALVFLARGLHHGADADSDGVPDHDRDADGLPDVVEDGLDALRELLRKALDAGGLSGGGWTEAGGSGAGTASASNGFFTFATQASEAASAVAPQRMGLRCSHNRRREVEGDEGAGGGEEPPEL